MRLGRLILSRAVVVVLLLVPIYASPLFAQDIASLELVPNNIASSIELFRARQLGDTFEKALNVTARAGVASIWGSGGPAPLQFCLTDEMGLKPSFYWGLQAAYTLAPSRNYSITFSGEILQFQFSGEGSAEADQVNTVLLRKGDQLSGVNNLSIASANGDLDLGVVGAPFFKALRIQWVNFSSSSSVTNKTRNWDISDNDSLSMMGIGGKIQFGLPINRLIGQSNIDSFISPKLKLEGVYGRGKIGPYYNWEAVLSFARYSMQTEYTKMFFSRGMVFNAEAGIAMWQFPLDPPVGSVVGRTDLLLFSILASAFF